MHVMQLIIAGERETKHKRVRFAAVIARNVALLLEEIRVVWNFLSGQIGGARLQAQLIIMAGKSRFGS